MTQIDLEEWLTSSQGDTPASPSRQPGSAEAIKMTDTSGQKCLELSKLCGPAGSLERMLLATSLWASTRCYLTWKAKDTKQGALLYRLSPQMPRTDETGAGSLVPTPDTRGFTNDGSLQMLMKIANSREEWSAMAYRAGRSQKERIWPTPAARDYKGMSGKGRQERKGNPKDTLPNAVGGSLNPQWVEWLMGYPVGYTDLNS